MDSLQNSFQQPHTVFFSILLVLSECLTIKIEVVFLAYHKIPQVKRTKEWCLPMPFIEPEAALGEQLEIQNSELPLPLPPPPPPPPLLHLLLFLCNQIKFLYQNIYKSKKKKLLLGSSWKYRILCSHIWIFLSLCNRVLYLGSLQHDLVNKLKMMNCGRWHLPPVPDNSEVDYGTHHHRTSITLTKETICSAKFNPTCSIWSTNNLLIIMFNLRKGM